MGVCNTCELKHSDEVFAMNQSDSMMNFSIPIPMQMSAESEPQIVNTLRRNENLNLAFLAVQQEVIRPEASRPPSHHSIAISQNRVFTAGDQTFRRPTNLQQQAVPQPRNPTRNESPEAAADNGLSEDIFDQFRNPQYQPATRLSYLHMPSAGFIEELRRMNVPESRIDR